MKTRWVIAGTLAIVGAYWTAVMMLIFFRPYGDWSAWVMLSAHIAAPPIVGALMVAHAPLRPWREPALAGVLAVVTLTVMMRGMHEEPFALLRSWPVAAGVAAGSGALAGLGGLATRRVVATSRTDLLLVLGAFVMAGTCAVLVRAMDLGILSALLGMVLGGFITQSVIPRPRPWACGVGGGMFVLLTLTSSFDGSVLIAAVVTWPVIVLLGALGAALSWWILRRGREVPAAEVPAARIG